MVPFEQNERQILIRQALETHLAKGGTVAVVDAVLGQSILFDAEFLMIAQTRIRPAMNDSIKHFGVTAGPSGHVVKEDLPRLTAIDSHLTTLASVRHTFAQADSPMDITIQRRLAREMIQMRGAL